MHWLTIHVFAPQVIWKGGGGHIINQQSHYNLKTESEDLFYKSWFQYIALTCHLLSVLASLQQFLLNHKRTIIGEKMKCVLGFTIFFIICSDIPLCLALYA